MDLGSAAEVQRLLINVHGTSIECGGEALHIDVQNLLQTTATLPLQQLIPYAGRSLPTPTVTAGNGSGDRIYQESLSTPETESLAGMGMTGQ